MVWMSLISMLTVSAPAPARWACELAPAYGQGYADEGRVDDLSTLSFGCGYRAYQVGQLSLWPVLSADTQNWTIHRDQANAREVSSYSVQDIGLGGRASYGLNTEWTFFYDLVAARGKGSLKKILSTEQSAANESHDRVEHTSLTHSLGAERILTKRLALSFGIQRLSASQKWKAKSGSYNQEFVDEQQHLSLTEGSTQLVGLPLRDSSRHQTTNLKIGLRMYLD